MTDFDTLTSAEIDVTYIVKVAGKWLNFHTVEYPQSKFPIR